MFFYLQYCSSHSGCRAFLEGHKKIRPSYEGRIQFRDTTLIPVALLLTGTLQRTIIRVSCNVEKSSALNTIQRCSSGMIFADPSLLVRTTHQFSENGLDRLLFPVVRFINILSKLSISVFYITFWVMSRETF